MDSGLFPDLASMSIPRKTLQTPVNSAYGVENITAIECKRVRKMRRNDRKESPTSGEFVPLAPDEISTEEVTIRLASKLRTLIGPGRRWSYSGVSHLTGIDTRSLQAYVLGDACPNLAKYKRLLSVLGPDLSSEIDQMYGWKPRASASAPESLDLGSIVVELRRSLDIIDDAIERARKL